MLDYNPDKKLSEYAASDVSVVLKELGSSEKGLASSEAEKRIREYGCNVFAKKKKLGLLLEILSHFKNPFIIILIVATIVSAYFGQVVDAIIIGIMILLSIGLDFFLEHNAEKAAEKLKERVKTKTIVVRNGERKEMPINELCIGDIIEVSAGSLIPADARIIRSKDFFVNQSSLTGESFPVEKSSQTLGIKELSLTDMSNMLFLGTNVISGSATAVVVKIGSSTEFGKIAKSLVSAEVETEFNRGIKSFGYLITKTIIFLVLFIFLANSLIKHNFLESFMFAIAVAVGLTPELLPMIMSINMAKGSLKMAEKGVIVKKLNSIPNLGSMDVLCTDKTGTLTEDKIQLVKFTDAFGKESHAVLEFAYLNSFHQTGIKNPLDEAVLDFKHENVREKIALYKKIDEVPFDFVRRKMSVIVSKSKRAYIITKGAPENVFKSCKYYHFKGKRVTLNARVLKRIKEQYYDFSKQGYRVLAVAVKQMASGSKRHDRAYTWNDECDLELMGFVAFFDPPKPDAGEMVKELEKAGIEVKILTGDNELVTKKICEEIGLNIKGVLLGQEIDTMDDDALKVRVEQTTIFARFSPEQKTRVIQALRKNNHIVGYMGDGINDAPSLKAADIGISVDSAVDVAKESADMILTQKSFEVLKNGVLEGRRTFGNTMKYIMMGLSSNFGNMFSVAPAVLFLPFLPMLPVQILLNNFIYDFSQITIPADNVDEEFIQKPKRWNMKFIKMFMILLGPISSVFDIITFILLFFVFKVTPAQFQTGWFIESIATQTLVIHVIRTKKIPFIQSTANWKLLLTSISCVVLAWIIPFTPIGEFFRFQPLPLHIMLAIVGLVVVYLVLVEFAKRLFYTKYDF
jgi:Mg2+-importing ATPase